MELLTIFFTFLIAILVAIYFYLRRNHGYIENLGIPIVKPFLCFGSPPFLHHKNLTHEYYERVSLVVQSKNNMDLGAIQIIHDTFLALIRPPSPV
jgi:hypothetical protein